MQAHEQPAFLALLTMLAGVYGKPLPEAVIELYWQLLQRFEFSSIKQALYAHLQNPDGGQFFPKPADVIRHIEGSGEHRAVRAWAQVLYAVQAQGAYRTLVFDDTLIHAVIADLGGWVMLCRTKTESLPFIAQKFEKRYRHYLVHAPTQYPKQLEGYGNDPPVFLNQLKTTQEFYLTHQPQQEDFIALNRNNSAEYKTHTRLNT